MIDAYDLGAGLTWSSDAIIDRRSIQCKHTMSGLQSEGLRCVMVLIGPCRGHHGNTGIFTDEHPLNTNKIPQNNHAAIDTLQYL